LTLLLVRLGLMTSFMVSVVTIVIRERQQTAAWSSSTKKALQERNSWLSMSSFVLNTNIQKLKREKELPNNQTSAEGRTITARNHEGTKKSSSTSEMMRDKHGGISGTRNDNNGYRDPLTQILTSTSAAVAAKGGNNGADHNNMLLPLPMQVVEEYRSLHSVDALRKNPHGRTYAIGFYSCP